MKSDDRIYVAGHRGLVGSALVRALHGAGYTSLITATHSELDLTDQAASRRFFEIEKPTHIFLAAATVGGIHANSTYGAKFIYDNLMISTNVIDAAYRNGSEKLLFLGSSCIYPKLAQQPMREDALLSGPLEPTNEPYALAKIAGIKTCAAYNRQYGTNYISVMPTNLYGLGDSYDLEDSHVIPALLRKFHEAKAKGQPKVVIWGTGSPKREFLYADDLAAACVFLMEHKDADEVGEHINIGSGQEVTIAELAQVISRVVAYPGELVFDSTKPDGTPRKLLDVSKLTGLGWAATTALEEGLAAAYADFVASNWNHDAPAGA